MFTKAIEHTKGWAGLFVMLEYFEDDQSSLEAIRTTRPSDLIVVPDLYIRLNRKNPANLTIVKVYPNRQEANFTSANNCAVERLRKLFANKRARWSSHLEKDFCVFHLPGKVICANRAKNSNERPQ